MVSSLDFFIMSYVSFRGALEANRHLLKKCQKRHVPPDEKPGKGDPKQENFLIILAILLSNTNGKPVPSPPMKFQ